MAKSFEIIKKLATINKNRTITFQSFYDPELFGKKAKVVGYTRSGLFIISFNQKGGWSYEASKDTWLAKAGLFEDENFFFLPNTRRTNLYFAKPEHLHGLK